MVLSANPVFLHSFMFDLQWLVLIDVGSRGITLLTFHLSFPSYLLCCMNCGPLIEVNGNLLTMLFCHLNKVNYLVNQFLIAFWLKWTLLYTPFPRLQTSATKAKVRIMVSLRICAANKKLLKNGSIVQWSILLYISNTEPLLI